MSRCCKTLFLFALILFIAADLHAVSEVVVPSVVHQSKFTTPQKNREEAEFATAATAFNFAVHVLHPKLVFNIYDYVPRYSYKQCVSKFFRLRENVKNDKYYAQFSYFFDAEKIDHFLEEHGLKDMVAGEFLRVDIRKCDNSGCFVLEDTESLSDTDYVLPNLSSLQSDGVNTEINHEGASISSRIRDAKDVLLIDITEEQDSVRRVKVFRRAFLQEKMLFFPAETAYSRIIESATKNALNDLQSRVAYVREISPRERVVIYMSRKKWNGLRRLFSKVKHFVLFLESDGIAIDVSEDDFFKVRYKLEQVENFDLHEIEKDVWEVVDKS